MTERARIDRLALALEAILADPRASLPPADPEVAELLPIARELCDLPRPAFKAALAADLERRATMSSPAAGPSASVNAAAVYFSGGFRTPFESTVAMSKATVRNDGFDKNLRMEGAAMMAPAPAPVSAATPSACRRVTPKNCRPGMVGCAAGAMEASGAATVEAGCSTRPFSLAVSRFSRLIISAKSDSHRLWLSSNPLR